MAPSKFQIYIDQSMKKPSGSNVAQPQQQPQPVESVIPIVQPEQNQDQPLRYKPEVLPPTSRFYFNERKIYPVSGGEYSFEELNFFHWQRHQRQLADKKRVDDIREENEELRHRIETLSQQLSQLVSAQNQMPRQRDNDHQNPPSPPTSNRLSVVPQSLQPAQGGLEYTDLPQYGATNEAPSSVIYYWRDTLGPDVSRTAFAQDKFTLPIDQSQFIRENVPTSTPTSKRPTEKRNNFDNRRMSRPSMGGSPTLKLSPITETSRECNSKSSSSSSAMTATPSTTKKVQPLVLEPLILDEPERPIDPSDPITYRRLLTRLSEPFANCFRLNRCLPKIRQGACFQAGSDEYLVDKELSREAKMFTAQLLTEDSNDTTDYPIKTICFRLDQPANEWLCYVCNELHRRLVKQKAKPDIELSVMIANPAVFYNDGSILIDEEFRFVTLENYFEACTRSNKPFPKSVAAYITLELIQLVRRMHSCDIIHMNIIPKNVLIICCPTREDITNVCERTSIVKLIGFDRAMDMRLLPADFKFETKLEDLMTCEMIDSRPWSHEIDWFGVLSCIHQMFFLDEMSAQKEKGRWGIDKQFKGLPTNVWCSMFDELLNMADLSKTNSLIDRATEELNTWVKANLSFVLKEADSLDRILTESSKNTEMSLK